MDFFAVLWYDNLTIQLRIRFGLFRRTMLRLFRAWRLRATETG